MVGVFGGDDELAEQAVSAAPRERRPTLALNAYGYWHLVMLPGIITMAALKKVTGEPFAYLPAAQALAGGVVGVFLLAEVGFAALSEFGADRGGLQRLRWSSLRCPWGLRRRL